MQQNPPQTSSHKSSPSYNGYYFVLWCVLTLTFRKNVCSIHTGDILLPFAREVQLFASRSFPPHCIQSAPLCACQVGPAERTQGNAQRRESGRISVSASLLLWRAGPLT